MMSLQNWLALLIFYILYLLIGGYSFRALENPQDCQDKIDEQDHRNRIRGHVQEFKGNSFPPFLVFLLRPIGPGESWVF